MCYSIRKDAKVLSDRQRSSCITSGLFLYFLLLLEYSIIEERLTSIMKHFGIRYTESNAQEFGIHKKFNKVNHAIEPSIHDVAFS